MCRCGAWWRDRGGGGGGEDFRFKGEISYLSHFSSVCCSLFNKQQLVQQLTAKSTEGCFFPCSVDSNFMIISINRRDWSNGKLGFFFCFFCFFVFV